MSNDQGKLLDRILVVLLVLVILITRFTGLDEFVTVDDGTRSLQAANSYDALAQREFGNTFQEYIPGVTTMWAGTAAMLIYFPEYRGLGVGQLDKEFAFHALLREHGKDPLVLLTLTRTLTALASAGTLIAILFVLRRLLPAGPALLLAGLMAFDPFYTGHSRLAAHEGLMSGWIVLSVVSMALHRKESDKHIPLVISAICAAIAALTKSTGVFVLPVIGLILLASTIGARNAFPSPVNTIKHNVLVPGIRWAFVFVLTYFIVWPAMWVAPLETFSNVYGDAASYALHGRNQEARETFGELEPASSDPGLSVYITSLILRSTPLTWTGCLLALIGLAPAIRRSPDKTLVYLCLFLLAQAAVFILALGLIRGRNSAHYILTAHVCLDLVAGIGYVWAAGWLMAWKPGFSRLALTSMAVLLVMAQAASAISQHPYYYTYYNSLIVWTQGPQTHSLGYGEGLELAAEYLAAKPNAEDDTVLAWYGLAFSYFYPGQTEVLFPSESWDTSLIERLMSSDYLVIYYTHQKQRKMPAKLLDDLKDVPVEHTIWLNGVEYIRIYDVDDLPPAVYVPDESTP